MHDYAIQEYQRQQIRDCHEGVHAVGYVPHYSEIGNAACKYCHDVEQTIDVGAALSLDIFHCSLAIIAPSENGAEGECQQAEAQYERTDDWNLRESHLRQLSTFAVVDVGIGYDTAYNDEPGERTYHHRVPECAR